MRPCGFGAVVCPRRAVGLAVLLRRFPRRAVGIVTLSRQFALGARLAMRFYCSVLPQFTPVFFPLSGKKRRLAIGSVSIPPGRDRHSCVLAALARLSSSVGSLRVWTFLAGDPDELPGTRRAENGKRGWRRSLYALLRNHIGFVMLSAGSTLGLRAPDCAKESSTLWTLFTLRRGCVGADSPRHHPGTRKDLTGSDLWPVRSGCMNIISICSLVQTRSAPKR